MKSRITIDLDSDNRPVIQIVHINSEDVRDKMVARFLETFSGSPLCRFQFTAYPDNASSISTIHPIPFVKLPEEIQVINAWVKECNRSDSPDPM